VNLRLGDLPGFTVSREPPAKHHGNEAQLEERLGHCAGALGANHGAGGEHGSPQFVQAGDQLGVRISSSVSFLTSNAAATSELAVLRSQRTRKCLVNYLQQLLHSQRLAGASAIHISIAQGSPPAPGSAGGFGWRVTAVFRVHRLTVPYYLDVLGFVYKRAEVMLLSSAALVPVPAGVEERLFTLLLGRATARPL
jgi:hypothetical protein